MTRSNHSEGDWKVATWRYPGQRPILTIVSSRDAIAQLLPLHYDNRDAAQAREYANARLLAATPKLLQIAQSVYALDRDGGPIDTAPIWRDLIHELAGRARAAINEVHQGTRPPTDETPTTETPR